MADILLICGIPAANDNDNITDVQNRLTHIANTAQQVYQPALEHAKAIAQQNMALQRAGYSFEQRSVIFAQNNHQPLSQGELTEYLLAQRTS